MILPKWLEICVLILLLTYTDSSLTMGEAYVQSFPWKGTGSRGRGRDWQVEKCRRSEDLARKVNGEAGSLGPWL